MKAKKVRHQLFLDEAVSQRLEALAEKGPGYARYRDDAHAPAGKTD